MPKERRTRSISVERHSRASPFLSSSSSSSDRRRNSRSSRNSLGSPARKPAAKEIEEWEEVRCPVCMEHPHNAVLLLCSSHDKGCRPFMCDTSYRHSNCLDQFRKLFAESSSSEDTQKDHQPTKLSCPLCRGGVNGWTVVEPARKYMNAKSRSCSTETCEFNGAYGELRKHARMEHPAVRPSAADPGREQNWRRMEQQRDMGDLLSTLRSAMGRRAAGEGDEYEGNVFAFPPVAIYLVLRVREHPVVGNARSPQPHHPEEREPYNNQTSPISTVNGDSVYDEDEDDGRSEETSAPSSGGLRQRQQLRMPDEEDEVL